MCLCKGNRSVWFLILSSYLTDLLLMFLLIICCSFWTFWYMIPGSSVFGLQSSRKQEQFNQNGRMAWVDSGDFDFQLWGKVIWCKFKICKFYSGRWMVVHVSSNKLVFLGILSCLFVEGSERSFYRILFFISGSFFCRWERAKILRL